MATYCFRCRKCGFETTWHSRDIESALGTCGHEELKRDYKAERIGFHIPGYMKTSNTSSKSDFLPNERDFESPSDPSGEKGMKEWKDTHQLVGKKELI